MLLHVPMEIFCRESQSADLEKFADHLASHYVPNSVIVDATASEVPAQKYLDWMKKGIHVITPNKKMNSGPLKQYRALKQFQRDSYIHFLYEVSQERIARSPVRAGVAKTTSFAADIMERLKKVMLSEAYLAFRKISLCPFFSELFL